MSFLVDTDTCSAHLRGRRDVTGRFLQYGGRLYISVVSVAELSCWMHKRNTPARYHVAYSSMMADLQVIDLDRSIAELCGKFSAQLAEVGRPPGTPDMLIAATALAHDLTLVTHNASDFHRVPGLRLQDWINP